MAVVETVAIPTDGAARGAANPVLSTAADSGSGQVEAGPLAFKPTDPHRIQPVASGLDVAKDAPEVLEFERVQSPAIDEHFGLATRGIPGQGSTELKARHHLTQTRPAPDAPQPRSGVVPEVSAYKVGLVGKLEALNGGLT